MASNGLDEHQLRELGKDCLSTHSFVQFFRQRQAKEIDDPGISRGRFVHGKDGRQGGKQRIEWPAVASEITTDESGLFFTTIAVDQLIGKLLIDHWLAVDTRIRFDSLAWRRTQNIRRASGKDDDIAGFQSDRRSRIVVQGGPAGA